MQVGSAQDLPRLSPKGSEEGIRTEPGRVVDVPVVEGSRTDGPEELQSKTQDEVPLPVPRDIPPLVEDGIHLILHLTGNGDNPRPEIISAVFAAKKAIDENSWSIEIGRTFLEAFSELAKQAKPITAKSLVESESLAAKGSIKRWGFLVWVLLPILILLSGLSFSNSRFAANANQLIQYSYKVEVPGFMPPSDDSGSTTASPGEARGSQRAAQAQIDGEQAQIDAIKETTAQMIANGQMLANMSLLDLFINYNAVFSPSEPKAATELTRQIAIMRDARTALKVVVAMNGIVYGVLNAYILPLLSALLGAAAYGLRWLSEQTLARTYRASYSAYARAILAVIVGFAVGAWFSDYTAKLSLQPLAAAFLAGYAVESFFIFLDTILQAVQKPRSSAT